MKFSQITTFLLLILSLSVWSQERREIGPLILEDIPEIPESLDERLKQYENSRGAYLKDWLPNGEGIIISTRFGNTTQLHLVAQPGAARQQITFADEPIANAFYSPSQEWDGFLFRKDIGGGEFDQLYWFDMESRNYHLVSDGSSKNSSPSWSNKGDKFIYSSTRRNGKNHDLYISDMDNPEKAELIIETNDGYWGVSDWQPNDQKILVVQYLSANEANTFIYNLKSKELRALSEKMPSGVNFGVGWTKSSSEIYMISDSDGEFNDLILYNLEDHSRVNLTKNISHNVDRFAISPDRNTVALTINNEGKSELYLLNTSSNQLKLYDKVPTSRIGSLNFSPDSKKLGFVMVSNNSPGDVYSMDLKSQELTRWTFSEIGGLDPDKFPEPELIAFPTFDKVNGATRKLSAFLYKPKQKVGPYPVLISIHGGPEGQARPGFNPMRSFLVNEYGIAVLVPNVRGSSGYGKSFLKLDNGKKREDSVKDIGALIEWVKEQPELDSSRIAVSGGSYGGYMVLSSMTHFNDDIACGIDIVGISNFVTFLENTQPYRQNARRAEYGDERDPEMRKFLESISPSNHVEKITKPLLVIQGANDPRVPLSESEQIVKAMREASNEVWFMVAKNEGHGFAKKDNREQMTRVIALFLKENLLKTIENASGQK